MSFSAASHQGEFEEACLTVAGWNEAGYVVDVSSLSFSDECIENVSALVSGLTPTHDAQHRPNPQTLAFSLMAFMDMCTVWRPLQLAGGWCCSFWCPECGSSSDSPLQPQFVPSSSLLLRPALRRLSRRPLAQQCTRHDLDAAVRRVHLLLPRPQCAGAGLQQRPDVWDGHGAAGVHTAERGNVCVSVCVRHCVSQINPNILSGT